MVAAKAWIALVGGIITALLGLDVIPTIGVWHTVLTIAAAICTSVLTYSIPNKQDPVVL
jgi:uncharacterized membrane protein